MSRLAFLPFLLLVLLSVSLETESAAAPPTFAATLAAARAAAAKAGATKFFASMDKSGFTAILSGAGADPTKSYTFLIPPDAVWLKYNRYFRLRSKAQMQELLGYHVILNKYTFAKLKASPLNQVFYTGDYHLPLYKTTAAAASKVGFAQTPARKTTVLITAADTYNGPRASVHLISALLGPPSWH